MPRCHLAASCSYPRRRHTVHETVPKLLRAGQGKRGKNYFRPLPSIESLRSKVFLKARTELFKAELVHLATRLSSSPTND
jgi:hypothetical protein